MEILKIKDWKKSKEKQFISFPEDYSIVLRIKDGEPFKVNDSVFLPPSKELTNMAQIKSFSEDNIHVKVQFYTSSKTVQINDIKSMVELVRETYQLIKARKVNGNTEGQGMA